MLHDGVTSNTVYIQIFEVMVFMVDLLSVKFSSSDFIDFNFSRDKTRRNTCRHDIKRNDFDLSSVIHGYHIYKDTWIAVIGEERNCERELGNRHDPFAVAIMKDG